MNLLTDTVDPTRNLSQRAFLTLNLKIGKDLI